MNHVRYSCLSLGKSILPGAFLVCIGFATLEPSHSSQRSRIPSRPEKIEIGTRDHSENRPKSPLDPDFHPVVVKIAKNDFLGRFGTKNGPRMVSESVRLGSPSPPKIDLVKNFPIQISISSKKPPTPGWLGVPKMHLTRKKIFSKAFYQAAVRAAGGGVAYGPYNKTF